MVLIIVLFPYHPSISGVAPAMDGMQDCRLCISGVADRLDMADSDVDEWFWHTVVRCKRCVHACEVWIV